MLWGVPLILIAAWPSQARSSARAARRRQHARGRPGITLCENGLGSPRPAPSRLASWRWDGAARASSSRSWAARGGARGGLTCRDTPLWPAAPWRRRPAPVPAELVELRRIPVFSRRHQLGACPSLVERVEPGGAVFEATGRPLLRDRRPARLSSRGRARSRSSPGLLRRDRPAPRRPDGGVRGAERFPLRARSDTFVETVRPARQRQAAGPSSRPGFRARSPTDASGQGPWNEPGTGGGKRAGSAPTSRGWLIELDREGRGSMRSPAISQASVAVRVVRSEGCGGLRLGTHGLYFRASTRLAAACF